MVSEIYLDALIQWWETNPLTRIFFSFDVIERAIPIIAEAFPVSVTFGLVSFLIAIPWGLALAFMKMSKSRLLRWPATVYVDIVRGTPLFMQVMVIYLGIPLIPEYQEFVKANLFLKEPFLFGVDYTVYMRGLFVLSLNSSAYMAEIFRAGIQSIHKGQMEAARSLGMTIPKAMIFVIIPQTVRRLLPTMMNEFILLFKDTALLAAVGINEITQRARQFAAVEFNMSAYVVAAVFYLLLTIPLGRVVAVLEERLERSEGGRSAEKPKMESA